MSKAALLVRNTALDVTDLARAAIVLACAGALILADAFLPL